MWWSFTPWFYWY